MWRRIQVDDIYALWHHSVEHKMHRDDNYGLDSNLNPNLNHNSDHIMCTLVMCHLCD